MSGMNVAASDALVGRVFVSREEAARSGFRIAEDACVIGKNLTQEKVNTVLRFWGYINHENPPSGGVLMKGHNEDWRRYEDYVREHDVHLILANRVSKETIDRDGLEIPSAMSILVGASQTGRERDAQEQEVLKLVSAIFRKKIPEKERMKAVFESMAYMQGHPEVHLKIEQNLDDGKDTSTSGCSIFKRCYSEQP